MLKSSAPSSPASASTASGPMMVTIMDDHFVINTVLRTRKKAKALRGLIELLESRLPAEDAQARLVRSDLSLGRSVSSVRIETT